VSAAISTGGISLFITFRSRSGVVAAPLTLSRFRSSAVFTWPWPVEGSGGGGGGGSTSLTGAFTGSFLTGAFAAVFPVVVLVWPMAALATPVVRTAARIRRSTVERMVVTITALLRLLRPCRRKPLPLCAAAH